MQKEQGQQSQTTEAKIWNICKKEWRRQRFFMSLYNNFFT